MLLIIASILIYAYELPWWMYGVAGVMYAFSVWWDMLKSGWWDRVFARQK